MGIVYRARDTALDREVAVEVLKPLFSSDPEWLRRFLREARTLAALNHPNMLTYKFVAFRLTPLVPVFAHPCSSPKVRKNRFWATAEEHDRDLYPPVVLGRVQRFPSHGNCDGVICFLRARELAELLGCSARDRDTILATRYWREDNAAHFGNSG